MLLLFHFFFCTFIHSKILFNSCFLMFCLFPFKIKYYKRQSLQTQGNTGGHMGSGLFRSRPLDPSAGFSSQFPKILQRKLEGVLNSLFFWPICNGLAGSNFPFLFYYCNYYFSLLLLRILCDNKLHTLFDVSFPVMSYSKPKDSTVVFAPPDQERILWLCLKCKWQAASFPPMKALLRR